MADGVLETGKLGVLVRVTEYLGWVSTEYFGMHLQGESRCDEKG